MNQNKMGLLTSLIGIGAGFEDINLPEGMGYNKPSGTLSKCESCGIEFSGITCRVIKYNKKKIRLCEHCYNKVKIGGSKNER